jgi:TRAP-type C4-dicarboxylate transport system substrate-binding protein
VGLSREDQRILQEVGQEVMGQQKKEAREGLEESTIIIEKLQDLYQMEVSYLSTADIDSFRAR